jgi:DNA-binding transcriptional LysR family regulator
MQRGDVDLNLLKGLAALVEEESVTMAAARLHLSQPAMSRTLARIRQTVGDPLLVRAGQRMLLTPYAEQLRAQAGTMLQSVTELLAPPPSVDERELDRTFTIIANDAMTNSFGLDLLQAVRAAAPKVSLTFVTETATPFQALRLPHVDLEIGVLDDPPVEAVTEDLTTDEHVVVFDAGRHPELRGVPAAATLAAADHVVVTRKARAFGPIDDALAEQGLRRRVAAIVPSFSTALLMLPGSDLVTTAPRKQYQRAIANLGLAWAPIAVPLPPLRIQQCWHPRYANDPGHRWLRKQLRRVVAE